MKNNFPAHEALEKYRGQFVLNECPGEKETHLFRFMNIENASVADCWLEFQSLLQIAGEMAKTLISARNQVNQGNFVNDDYVVSLCDTVLTKYKTLTGEQ